MAFDQHLIFGGNGLPQIIIRIKYSIQQSRRAQINRQAANARILQCRQCRHRQFSIMAGLMGADHLSPHLGQLTFRVKGVRLHPQDIARIGQTQGARLMF